MTTAPAIMAMFERASPKLWIRMLRRLRSPRPRTSARVMPPFTARAVGLFAVSGTLGIAHGEIGNADGGNIRKIVNGIVQEGDAAAQDSAEYFSDHQTESGGHGPAQHGRAECRVSVIMIVVMR